MSHEEPCGEHCYLCNAVIKFGDEAVWCLEKRVWYCMSCRLAKPSVRECLACGKVHE